MRTLESRSGPLTSGSLTLGPLTSVRRSSGRLATSALAVALSVLGATPATPQVEMSATEPPVGATLSGVVRDSITGDPIEGVMVRVDTGEEVVTDARGRFELADLPEGKRLVALLTSDCRITWGQVTVLSRFPRHVDFRLPPVFGAAAEEERRVRAERRRGGGKRVEAEEIDAMNARSMTEVVRRVAPAMVRGNPGQVGGTPTISSGRNSSFLANDPPVVVIDGVRVPNPEFALDQLQPSEVQVLEVRPGAAAGWEYGTGGAGGVIEITLRRGVATGAPERRTRARCTVPAFPGG